MHRFNRGAVTGLVALVAALASGPSLAQPVEPPGAGAQVDEAEGEAVGALLREGRTALKARRLEDAREAFQAGLKRATEPPMVWRMLLGLALVHELEGHPVQAASHYQAFLSASEGSRDATSASWTERRTSAAKDLEALEQEALLTHGRLELVTDPPAAAIALDGEPVPTRLQTPGVLYLAPGQHAVELRREGHASVVLVVIAREGERLKVERALEAVAPPPAPEPVVERVTVPLPVPKPVPEPYVDPVFLGVGWAFVGVGGAALVAGIGTSVATLSTSNALNELQEVELDDAALARDVELRDELRTRQAAAAAMYGLGGAMVVSGVLVLLLHRPAETKANGWSVEPTLGGLRGSF